MRREQSAGVTWRRIQGKGLPADALQSTHDVEMAVTAQEREMVLTAEGGDPDVVNGNGLANLLKLEMNCCVVMRGFIRDVQDPAHS